MLQKQLIPVSYTHLDVYKRQGLYYNYNKEHIFVPGRTDFTIIPITDTYGTEENTIREGVAEATNFFYNLNACYNKQFNNRHALNVLAGVQILTTQQEYDGAYARNTTNDFYQVLGSADAIGRYFDGYQNKWNWANIYGHVDYTYNNVCLLYTSHSTYRG